MENKNVEEKLTPAAKEAVNELVQMYRDQIIMNAEKHASKYFTREISEISVYNIVESMNTNKELLPNKSPIGKLLEVYKNVGVVIAAVGSIYLLLNYSKSNFMDNFTFVIIGILTGLTLYLASYFLSKTDLFRKISFGLLKFIKKSSAEEETKISTSVYIDLWIKIELSIREIVAIEFGESTATGTFSQQLELLENSAILRPVTVDTLRELDTIRNKIMHTKNIDIKTIDNAISMAIRMLNYLKQMQQNKLEK